VEYMVVIRDSTRDAVRHCCYGEDRHWLAWVNMPTHPHRDRENTLTNPVYWFIRGE